MKLLKLQESKPFNVLSVWWYIKFCDVSLQVFFCCFTAAQLNAINTRNACNILQTKSPGMNQTCWPHDKIQDDGEKDKWVDQSFTKSKEKFFMKIIFNIIVTGFVPRLWVMTLWKIFAVDTQPSKYSRKRNRFSIVNMWESNWMTDVTDGCG